MKKPILISWFLIFGLFLMQSTALYAQDSVKVATEIHKKVLVDNDKVTMMEVEFAPGDVTPWHHHPNYLTYVLSEGQLEITVKGKQPEVANVKPGGYTYSPAETHMIKNTGTTPVKLLIIELKLAQAQKMSAPAKPVVKK
jgi:quercetin dioxygenase-like cupin family protein